MLKKEELIQYSRQLMLPDVGMDGQTCLKNAHVAIIGMGGLGSPSAMYLASAGIGTLTLVDGDQVERSNLQRQIIHQQTSIGQAKVDSAAALLEQLNPYCTIHTQKSMLNADTATNLLSGADVVIDASDNFPTRFLLNKLCGQRGIPLISGAAIRFEAQLMVIRHDKKQAGESLPCYNCVYPETAEHAANCATAGIIAPLVGVIGSMQALEAMKILLGFGAEGNVLQLLDAKTSQWRSLIVAPDAQCPSCLATHISQSE